MNGEQRPGWYFARAQAQDGLNLRILHMFEGTFSLDAAHFSTDYHSYVSVNTHSHNIRLQLTFG